MFRCNICGTLFDEPVSIPKETYLGQGIWEPDVRELCPICYTEDFEEEVADEEEEE